MGRTGSGVEVRERSIRLSFVFEGQPQRPTLMVNGKPMAPTPANVKYAHRLAAEIRDRIRHGTFSMAEYFPASGSGGQLTLAAWLETWLTAQRVEASTRAGYASAARFWSIALGTKPLRSLKHSDVLAVLAAHPGLSGKTVNNYVAVLHQAMALALRDKLVFDDPSVGIPRATWQRDPPDPFSLDEAERIIDDMRTHYPQPIYNMVEFWFFSGPRTSEMAGLHWGKIDFASSYARIDEALVRGVEKDSTKTGVSRDVMLNSRALGAMQRQRAHSFLAGGHVWLDPRYGTPWVDERAFRRSYWTPTLKRLGIRYRRPYNMRHTYATMLLMMPEPNIAWNASQLGHSVEVYLRTYAKWIHGAADQRQMAGLERWLKRSGT